MLTSRIHISPPSDPEPEDIFHSSLPALFSDDTINSHGNPGDTLIYQSPLYGEITVHVPVHPDRDVSRLLFAHYLWNAGVVVADKIESASRCHQRMSEHESPECDRHFWNVRGERVLELGAGTALPSMISILAGASEVCITDHPSSPALASTTQANVQEFLQLAERENLSPRFSIEAHEWGSVMDTFAQKKRNHYTRIIAADCLWMPSQHGNLVHSIAHFLSKESSEACALIVAGFHTGRNIVGDFFGQFSMCNDKDASAAELSIAEIYESDMNGTRRPWQEKRANESIEEAKWWCVVALIVRAVKGV